MEKSKNVSRRKFLATTGLATGALMMPSGLLANAFEKRARYVRPNVTSAAGQQALVSYARGIRAMLNLPPTDPRNWYRNAMIHLMDCPHGNFWFFPWHRGYIGWFEKTIRELSGDPNFVLPYWDWTADPFIPASMFQGVLTPTNSAYYADFAAFNSDFNGPVTAFYNSLSANQKQKLNVRGIPSASSLISNLQSNWSSRTHARALTPSSPGFNSRTRVAVSIGTINSALAATTFVDKNGARGWGSLPAAQHSDYAGSDILEGQPHNQVHNNVSGFMGQFMSPVDPIFFLHHCNVDRLWDVWTRKQQRNGQPTLPTDASLKARWEAEEFLFYISPTGSNVAQNRSGDYNTPAIFDYSYTQGSGDNVLLASASIPKNLMQKSFAVKLDKNFVSSAASNGNLNLRGNALQAVKASADLPMFICVTAKFPSTTEGVSYHVLVNVDDDDDFVDFNSPHYVGTFQFFGAMNHKHEGSFSFNLALNDALAKLAAAGLSNTESLNFKVVIDREGIALKALEAEIESISIGVI